MTIALGKWFCIESHVIDQVGVAVSEAILVAGEDEIVEVISEAINQPMVFA